MLYILLICLFFGCQNKKEPANDSLSSSEQIIIGDTLSIESNQLEIQVLGGVGFYQDKRFTGYVTKSHTNSQLAQQILYINGRREGTARYWFEDGKVKKTKNFADNQLNGTTIVYAKSGEMLSLKNYKNNRLHGIQENWHPDGKLAKRQNYVNGREQGLQQAWNRKGKIYANYEALNGRTFGLNRKDLCFGLKDENIKSKN